MVISHSFLLCSEAPFYAAYKFKLREVWRKATARRRLLTDMRGSAVRLQNIKKKKNGAMVHKLGIFLFLTSLKKAEGISPTNLKRSALSILFPVDHKPDIEDICPHRPVFLCPSSKSGKASIKQYHFTTFTHNLSISANSPRCRPREQPASAP